MNGSIEAQVNGALQQLTANTDKTSKNSAALRTMVLQGLDEIMQLLGQLRIPDVSAMKNDLKKCQDDLANSKKEIDTVKATLQKCGEDMTELNDKHKQVLEQLKQKEISEKAAQDELTKIRSEQTKLTDEIKRCNEKYNDILQNVIAKINEQAGLLEKINLDPNDYNGKITAIKNTIQRLIDQSNTGTSAGQSSPSGGPPFNITRQGNQIFLPANLNPRPSSSVTAQPSSSIVSDIGFQSPLSSSAASSPSGGILSPSSPISSMNTPSPVGSEAQDEAVMNRRLQRARNLQQARQNSPRSRTIRPDTSWIRRNNQLGGKKRHKHTKKRRNRRRKSRKFWRH